MKLLAAKLYDPAAAVSKSTASLLAMTAFDTTNLRLAVTVPAHGMLRIRMATVITGATTVPTIFLGVLNGATVVGRVNPQDFPGTMNAATQTSPAVADFIVTGLTPGAMNLDAAYGVEVVVALTNIKYGGPNDTTTNNAWGGFQFEVWDPAPQPANYSSLAIDASGRVTVGSIVNGAIAAATFAANALDAVWSTAARVLTAGTNIVLAKGTGVTGFNDLSAAQVNAEADTALADAGVTTAVMARLDVAVSTRNATAPLDAAGVRGAVGLASANLDTQLDGLPTAAAIRAEMDANSTDLDAIGALATSIDGKVDVAVSTRLAGADYIEPDNTGIAAIQAKTDGLTFTVAGKLDVNMLYVNGVQVGGAGTSGSPWGPA